MPEGRHPHFTSGLSWHSRLDDALAAARESDKRVFLLHGRQTCGGSRAMVERTLNKEELVEYVNGHFVLLASDADRAPEDVTVLLAGLPRQQPTPVCVYLDRDGRVLHSTAGGRPPAVLLNDLLEAARKNLPR